ncbi:MAG TPA: baseplate assembly protein, partial [Sphingomonas sp.]
LDAYLVENRRLGRTITRSGLIAALSPPGVHRVDLDLAADVACDPTQAAWCTSITLAFAGYAA